MALGRFDIIPPVIMEVFNVYLVFFLLSGNPFAVIYSY